MPADRNASSSGASSEPPEPEGLDYYKKGWKDKESAQTFPAPEKFELYQKWSSAQWEPWLQSMPDAASPWL
eukprot:12719194-Heterocapsa_arctica.AAC.1